MVNMNDIYSCLKHRIKRRCNKVNRKETHVNIAIISIEEKTEK